MQPHGILCGACCVGAIFRASDQGAYWSAAPPTTTSTKLAPKQSTLGDFETHPVCFRFNLTLGRCGWHARGPFAVGGPIGRGCRRGPRSPWPWPRPACVRECRAPPPSRLRPRSLPMAFVCRANKGQICGSRYSCSSACCRVNNAVESICK